MPPLVSSEAPAPIISTVPNEPALLPRSKPEASAVPLSEIVRKPVPLSLTVSCPDCKELPEPVIFSVPWDPTCVPSVTVVDAMALPPAAMFNLPVPKKPTLRATAFHWEPMPFMVAVPD
ncbi:hypothetical protein D3C86_1283940 [compost metagenome]